MTFSPMDNEYRFKQVGRVFGVFHPAGHVECAVHAHDVVCTAEDGGYSLEMSPLFLGILSQRTLKMPPGHKVVGLFLRSRGKHQVLLSEVLCGLPSRAV